MLLIIFICRNVRGLIAAVHKVKMSLLNSKMSLEKAKKCLEGYYKMRTLYADFFDRLLPESEYFTKGKKYS